MKALVARHADFYGSGVFLGDIRRIVTANEMAVVINIEDLDDGPDGLIKERKPAPAADKHDQASS